MSRTADPRHLQTARRGECAGEESRLRLRGDHHLASERLPFVHRLPHAVDRTRQTLSIERFQEVIDGVVLERIDGVLIERRAEDDLRSWRREGRHQLHARTARHLDVEKHKIRSRLGDLLQGLLGISGNTDHPHGPDLAEQSPQAVASRLFVVDQHRADHRPTTAGSAGSRLAAPGTRASGESGMMMATTVIRRASSCPRTSSA